ncbi:hypothetical protein RHMOL_Rhmol07G0116000 [Rhododendron molle]|uniref:Uncharacterized protein n=1 Tax=Rhododendron molle TaxID=49168 RepID=A0ACC0N0Y7_RHOML|nr:hypothetical protein RHMOL_Rhmol07G0116000 [Rhododendron molle]
MTYAVGPTQQARLPVKNANTLENAKGTVVGMVPGAPWAIYKMCLGLDCLGTDMLAGFDADMITVLILGYNEKEGSVHIEILSAQKNKAYLGETLGRHPSNVELNEPSFSVTLGRPQTFNRTVTNVGVARASYFVRVLALQGVDVSIKPENFHKSETEANIFGDIHP